MTEKEKLEIEVDDNENEFGDDDDFGDDDEDFNDDDEFGDEEDDDDWDGVDVSFDRQTSDISSIAKESMSPKSKKEEKKTWNCSICGFVNAMSVKQCLMCKDDPKFDLHKKNNKNDNNSNNNNNDDSDENNNNNEESDEDDDDEISHLPIWRQAQERKIRVIVKKLKEMFPDIKKNVIRALLCQKCHYDFELTMEMLLKYHEQLKHAQLGGDDSDDDEENNKNKKKKK